MKRKSTKQQIDWSEVQVRALRERIKDKIEAIESAGDAQAVMPWIFAQLSETRSTASEEQHPYSYVLMMSALLHHVRNQSLKRSDINRMFEDVKQTLVLGGVVAGHPRHEVLNSDLHSIMSQIELREGQLWSSIWHQKIASKPTQSATDEDAPYHSLAAGIRSFRFGLGSLAERELKFAEEHHQKPRERLKARLQRIKLKRLTCDWEGFHQLLQELISTPDLPKDFQDEAQWEKMCADAAQSGDSADLFRAIQKSQSHYEASYVADGRMRMLAEPTIRRMQKLTKLSTISADRDLDIKQLGKTYRTMAVLEGAYDGVVPHQKRLDAVGAALQTLSQLASFEQELLVLLAASRWLSRNNETSLAEVCLAEYRAKSLRLSNGGCGDALNLASDLFDRKWFRAA